MRNAYDRGREIFLPKLPIGTKKSDFTTLFVQKIPILQNADMS